ncbi:MAG: signal peptidase I [Ruminococcaceae bacterium]|nr:signal peptidase I [Oscillospiraceae bacterium]
MNRDERTGASPEERSRDLPLSPEETVGEAPDMTAPAETPPEDRLPPKEKKPLDLRRELFDWSEALVTALILIVVLFAFFVRSIGVSGDSMIHTLHNGDGLIVSNLFYEPKAGDIVVMTKKTFMKDSFVKRIIATEGQTVDMDFEKGIVYIDGEPQYEPYLREQMWKSDDFEGPITVPDGHIFVMGDNRNGSTDSRSDLCGTVDERYIVGRVLLRIWPLADFGTPD